MTPDPDPYCDHDWQFAERPTNEAKPVKLRCSKCGAIKDYSTAPAPTENAEASCRRLEALIHREQR